MPNAPRISVLLTSYNREHYIAAAIESVLAQSLTDFELLIVDDGSTDGTVGIARRYLSDPRVRLVQNDRNLGQFQNRNYAATLARGEFLKYHDSDDLMYPHCLSVMAEALAAEPRAALALSAHSAWSGGPAPMLLTPQLAYEREFLGYGLFQLGPAAAMFRVQAFRDLGGFPVAGVASDYMFWLKVCAAANVLLVPADLFYYRWHPGQEVASAGAELEYAKTIAAPAWEMLNSPDCPLRGPALEQAKRNFLYTLARDAYRHLRRRRFVPAAALIAHSNVKPGEWLRYLRPARRSGTAGSPEQRGGVPG
jgi:glycosyltransferase involved in cell wall biosynthesis